MIKKSKFKVGDKVKVVSDKRADYGRYLGKTGFIAFVGSVRYEGGRTYFLLIPNDTYELRVFEADLKKVK